MKITYAENPLLTKVELDEHDRQVFWLKIKIEQLQDKLFSTNFHLTEGKKFFNLEQARRESAPEQYIKEDDQEKTPLDKRVDELLAYYIEELLGTHVGDCTCVACSCCKCHAESILGIDTLKPYPGKHELSYIDSAFSYIENGETKTRSLNDAIIYLRDHKISHAKPESWKRSTQEEYESYILCWEAQQARAYEYLKNYAKEHFTIE